MDAIADTHSQEDFANAFGNALTGYVRERGMQRNDLVELLGLDKKIGKARISTYCREGKRVKPDAEILCLACSRLPGFSFVYRGYRISAATLNGNGTKPPDRPAEQLTLGFESQFSLTGKQGTVAVRVSRPQRIEVSLSLEAKVS